MENFCDIDELAVLMELTTRTIRRRILRRPFDVPPKVHFAGSKMLRWRESEVKTWLYEHGYSQRFTKAEWILQSLSKSSCGQSSGTCVQAIDNENPLPTA